MKDLLCPGGVDDACVLKFNSQIRVELVYAKIQASGGNQITKPDYVDCSFYVVGQNR